MNIWSLLPLLEIWAVAFAVFLRVGSAAALLPMLGERAIPMRVRLIFALAYTSIVAPVVWADLAGALPFGTGWLLFGGAEVVTGLTLGVALRLLILALQVAGTIAAQAVSLSQIFGAAGVEPMPAIGHILTVGGLALAAILGLHVQLAGYLVQSYQVIPPGVFWLSADLAHWGSNHVAHSFSLAFSLAAPFVLVSVIYNLALGVINRAMPQLMVSFVGAPAITGGGLLLITLSAPVLLAVWVRAVSEVLANPTGLP